MENDYLATADALENALRLAPRASAVWDMASDIYHTLSRANVSYTARAIECCQKSLALQGPSNKATAPTWSNLANVLTEVGRHNESIDAAKIAMTLDGSFHHGYQHAEALLMAKRHEEAQAAYQALLRRADARAQPCLLYTSPSPRDS